MVCSAACPAPRPRWHRIFRRQVLPATVARAKFAFRHLRGQDYQDAIQETIANALVAFVALVRRGRMGICLPDRAGPLRHCPGCRMGVVSDRR